MAGNMNRTGENQRPIPMRHLGELPQDTTAPEHGGVESSDAMGHSASATEQEGRSAVNQGAEPDAGQQAPARDTASSPQASRQSPENASGPGNPQPVHTGPAHKPGSAVVGAAGGTDASAGAQLSGSKGSASSKPPPNTVAPGGPTGAPGGALQGGTPADSAASNPAAGTGLGSAGASASDARTGTGTSSGTASNLGGSETTGKRGGS